MKHHKELNDVSREIKQLEDSGPEVISIRAAAWICIKMYLTIMVVVYLGVGLYQESNQPKRPIGRWIREQLGHHDFHDFLREQSLELDVPYDEEVPECDYKTMTPKRFFNDYVKLNRPCIFRGYGTL